MRHARVSLRLGGGFDQGLRTPRLGAVSHVLTVLSWLADLFDENFRPMKLAACDLKLPSNYFRYRFLEEW